QEDHEEEEGILENSSIDTNSGTAGVSWITPRGFLGVSVNRFETNYGVPGHGHHEEEGLSAQQEEEEEEHVRIDMNQTRFDLKGERTFDGLLRRVRVRFGTTDYEHVELEGAEIGTEFTNEAWEGRIEAAHGPLGALEGTVGAQISRRDFAAFGEEAFVPPTETGTEALFVFEELERGDWSYQFGARYEHQDVTVHAADLPDRSFSGLSGSIGAVWFAEGAPGIIAASIARAVRLPTAEELYSNGPHAATRTFEVGDVNLDEETSLGVDLSFRRNVGPVQGELTLFWSDFSGFIFPHPTGEVEDGLPVFFYRQSDATFTGLEALMHITVWEREPHHLEIEIGGDLVDADLDGGGNLSRIAPARLFAGLIYQGERWFADVTARHVFDQDDVADFEEPTDGYTLLEANAGFRFLMGETAHQVILRGRNLTDELARSHVSPLKEVAPLPGRDLSLAYRLIF
ncbi:MAG TPA: TonB-dependent receptor, partial [Thermoanaerobaculia bacterium]|nr:TonB-dependent receptor [Thermoanaerobaculia bacterium]